ncbi:hypothetical protein Plhal304r1_c036g0110681 [Plasmopara halstedii]
MSGTITILSAEGLEPAPHSVRSRSIDHSTHATGSIVPLSVIALGVLIRHDKKYLVRSHGHVGVGCRFEFCK